MKTHKHGNGMTHDQVVTFSNRLAFQGQCKLYKTEKGITYSAGFDDGWSSACKYFAHILRKKLREIENNNKEDKTIEKYNYLQTVTAKAKEWLLNHYETEFIINSKDYSEFYKEMFNDDSVTGNASGSYTFNTWQAEENLCHNMHLLELAANKFGYNEIPRDWLESAETADVIIRCYYLNEAIKNAIEEIRKENKK